jgi:hypothetical protein
MPPGSSSRSKMVPKKWSGPRFETQGSAPRTTYPPSTLRPFSFSFSIPKKLFIGLERPVPPRIRPVANLSANLAISFGLLEFAAYQTSVFWHHAMKAVAPHTSPSAAID